MMLFLLGVFSIAGCASVTVDKARTTTPTTPTTPCGNCTADGLWSLWEFTSTQCITSWTWTEKTTYVNGKWSHTRTKVLLNCGMYGRQPQIRTCLSNPLGCPCKGDVVRQVGCGSATVCSIKELPGIDCAPGYVKSGSICVQSSPPPPESNITAEINERCVLKPNCACPKGGAWSDYEWLESAPCPTIPTYLYSQNASLYKPYEACGACQQQLQQRFCVSAVRGCPCTGSPYRLMRCNPTMCTFPLFRCCNDIDNIKQQVNYSTKRYECLPTPIDKWSLVSTQTDPYASNSTCFKDLQIG
ncbi:unnamed protein product, partial [Mesorhabditis belari]|uniref:Uncharacterized protein n=1 Tax=Mesorhabditis belari TaxID=2138241 RepID=A0AAF3ETB4_9BILA